MADYVRQRLQEIRAKTDETVRHQEAIKVAPVSLNEKTASSVRVGYVYFIKSVDKVKIGFTADLSKRLKQFKTGSSNPINVLAVVPGTQDTEAYFHSMFADYRVNGEWFRYEGDLKRFTAAMPARLAAPKRIGPAYILSDEFAL